MFENKYSTVTRRSQDQQGDLATAVEESVHGIRVLKAFGRGRYSLEKFTRQAEELRGTEIEKARAIAGIWLWLLLVPDVAFALSLLGGVWLASTGEMAVGQVFAFFATATVLRWPIESIGFLLSFPLDTRTAIDRLFEVLDEENTIVDPASRITSRGRAGAEVRRRPLPVSGLPATEPDILDGVDLELEPGETMALVGLTGSGKTTLTTLPTRLYDVTGGRSARRGRRARPHTAGAPHPHGDGLRGRHAVLAERARQRAARPGRALRAVRMPTPCCARRSTSPRRASSTTCPRASTRSSARRA